MADALLDAQTLRDPSGPLALVAHCAVDLLDLRKDAGPA